MKGVVAEHAILLIGLLGMEQRERGAETDLGCWLGVRGDDPTEINARGDMMMKQR